MEPMTDTTGAEASAGPKVVALSSTRLQQIQYRYALATMLVPLLATLAAVALLFVRPIGAVEISLFAVMYVLTSTGLTVGFHRHFAHRAFKAKPALTAALGILGCMGAQGSPVYWAATHRRHHAFSEQEQDPHSPYVHEGQPLGFWRGLWHSHLGWMLDSKMTNTVAFAKDLMRDPLIARINAHYGLWVVLGLAIPMVLGGLLTMSWMGALTGLLWGGFVRMFCVHHLMWTSGSTAHILGTRPFETRDASRNNIVLALPNFGEAWHNNHHAFPGSAMFGLRWWQVDPGGWIIRLFVALGWAWDLRVPTPEAMQTKRMQHEPQARSGPRIFYPRSATVSRPEPR